MGCTTFPLFNFFRSLSDVFWLHVLIILLFSALIPC